MKPTRRYYDVIIQALFVIYVYVLFKIILFKFGSIDLTFLWKQLKRSLGNPNSISNRLQEGNLIPFHEISRTMNHLSSHDLINLIGNIAVFMPYGFFLGLLSTGKTISGRGAFVRSLGLSLCLECAQFVFSMGRFDVDDLLLNSCGGLIGCMFFKICTKFRTAASSVRKRDRPANAR